METPIHEETFNHHHIKILHDPDPESPHDWDNLGTMSCWHRRYRLGDSHTYDDPRDLLIDLAGMPPGTELGMNALFARAERHAVILPLYLYDHSGITMNTTGFHCPWDSGQVGYIHVSLKEVRETFSRRRVSPALRKRVTKNLIDEVATYDNYLTGNCYGFVIEKDEEEIDACWGFLGDYRDHCLSEARAQLR
ncbi:hypothetical protein [Labrenzia sp. DG1229]|uniref:hypothetical protein n=1 Tax=Labrenzia sp. DG1229 TaxID=681847 RepID=UPI0007C6D1F0|nr:hypothetical protein [Labrenzia sp. DG1229]